MRLAVECGERAKAQLSVRRVVRADTRKIAIDRVGRICGIAGKAAAHEQPHGIFERGGKIRMIGHDYTVRAPEGAKIPRRTKRAFPHRDRGAHVVGKGKKPRGVVAFARDDAEAFESFERRADGLHGGEVGFAVGDQRHFPAGYVAAQEFRDVAERSENDIRIGRFIFL